MSSNTKHTRSRNNLPESFHFPSLDRSPLKAARTAARTVNTTFKPALSKNIFPTAATLARPMDKICMKDAGMQMNDEAQVAPRGSSGKKRPSSGGRSDENRAIDDGFERGRDYKRARTEDPGVLPGTPKRRGVSASRSPSPARISTPSRSRSVPPRNVPGSSHQPEAPAPSTPSSTPKPALIPHIDLNEVAASPWKPPISGTPRVAPVAETMGQPVSKTPRPPAQNVLAQTMNSSVAADTPRAQVSCTIPLSPLTPLPRTPFLDKVRQTRTVGRSGLRIEIEDETAQEAVSSSSDLMDGFASSLASPRLTQAVVELPAKQFERQLSADRLSHASNSQSSSSDLKDGHVSSFAPLSQQESAVDLPVQQPESQPSASIATFDELSHASNSESSSSDLKDDHVSSLSRQESDIEFPVQQPETQQSAFTSSSDAPSHVSRDHAPLPAPAPSRLPRLSLASSAAPPVIPPASSTTPATVTSPGSGAQPSKKPTSKTSVAGGARTRLKERAAKDAVLGGGRVTRSVALRMKAGKSVTAPKAAENQPKEPATPGLTRRKSFSFAVPTASSLSKAKPATQPTTPGKSKSQSRPTTPSRVPVPTTSTSRTPSRPSGSTSIPRRAATVAPLEQKSSLSSLSMALQKLNLPPPSRPSTSLGFNDGDDDLPAEDRRMKLETQDDIELGVSPRKRRSSTVAPTASLSVTGGKGPALASEARRAEITLSKGPGIPKPSASISARLPVAGPSAGSAPKKSTLDAWVVKARAANGLGRTAPGKIFGSGVGGAGRPGMWQRPKASRAPALEVVEGSPVKGVGAAEPDEQLVCEPPVAALNFSARNEDVSMEPIIPKVDEDQATPVLDKGKGKEKEQSAPEPVRDIRPSFKRDASRRASMASQALSESLSSVPPLHTPSGPGLMGPPAVPPFRSGGYKRAATLEPSASTPSTEEGSVMTTARGRPMRAAALQARSAPGLMRRATKTTATHVSAGRKGRAESVPPDNGLGVLKDCTIFVDVRTDDGDDAGGLFVEMLTGLGAKILSRVGQSCTHIVFKNGLMSTVTRYRLLNDPKPHVVGIAWVVECVEQRAKAEESKFGVDMEDAGIAGAAKRRRPSMLPKHMPISMHGISQTDSSPTTEPAAEGSDAGDQSIDGSSSSLILDETPLAGRSVPADSLPPLERARRRRSMLFGQP